MSYQQNVGQSHSFKVTAIIFENVAYLKYLETTLSNRNYNKEEVEKKLNSGNACYMSRMFVVTPDI